MKDIDTVLCKHPLDHSFYGCADIQLKFELSILNQLIVKTGCLWNNVPDPRILIFIDKLRQKQTTLELGTVSQSYSSIDY